MVTRVLKVAGLVVFLSVSHLLAADDKGTDQEKMQGQWKLVDVNDSDGITKKRGFDEHVLVIKGGEMWEEPPAGEKAARRPFKLDPAKDLKRIDFRTEGKSKEGQQRYGVYSLDGDKLTICFSTAAPAEEARRPTDFTVKPGSGRVLLVYERVKK
jgi:uncharacterized protein (TIGR03067 family)